MNVSWTQVFLATVLAWVGALIGVELRHAAGRFMRSLVYLALLFFALVAIFDILPASKQSLSWPILLSAAAAGYGVFWLIGKYLFPICPACAMRTPEDDPHHMHGSGLAIVVLVLGIHCFIDGLGISTASTVQASLGLRLFGAIALHKLPEGFALTMVLMAGGRSPWEAFGWTIGIETTTLAGALAGSVWMHPSEFWIALVLAHIAGTFLYLSVSGLLDALSPRTTWAH